MISVIIPVYNGEPFIEKAIRSALHQVEIAEVIVVNDGSTDGTHAILTLLQNENQKVKVFQHPNHENKGRSATRNLGLQNATGNYIAFLDADDYYLPNRFINDFKLFGSNNAIDGVYNAIGAYYYENVTINTDENLCLSTVSEKISYKNLFNELLAGKKGHFSIIGLTIKRTVFDKVGFFNEKLAVAEDTELIWKMALSSRLEAGIIDKAVAMRGIHNNNVFYRRDLYEQDDLRLYESMYEWSTRNNINLSTTERFLERVWILKYRKHESKYEYFTYWVWLNFKVPKLMFSYLSIKYFPLTRYIKKKF